MKGRKLLMITGSIEFEPKDNMLVISTGDFGERYVEICKRYGANVTILTTEVGKTNFIK